MTRTIISRPEDEKRWLESYGRRRRISSAEVLSGGTADEAHCARELCDKFECLSLTKDDATVAADQRRARRWKLPDALQAAVAKRHGLKLVTRDARGFDEKRHRFVPVLYRLR